MNDRWLSMREICEYLGVSHDTISRWIAKDMPAMKMGDRWKFKRDLVEKWLQDGGPKKKVQKSYAGIIERTQNVHLKVLFSALEI